MIYYDTETIGLHGTIMLLQYAKDDGPIQLVDVWDQTPRVLMDLFESFMLEDCLVGFNLTFDHFHLTKMYNVLTTLNPDVILHEQVEDYHANECKVPRNKCLKPTACLDLFLFARKGPYQSTMDRKDIRIKRVPRVLAQSLCDELNRRVYIKEVYFARKTDPTKRFEVCEKAGSDFLDIKLSFAPSGAMKALAVDTGVTDAGRVLYSDIELPDYLVPKQLGYSPFGGWLDVFPYHYKHWKTNEPARAYAGLDIDDTRKLYRFFAAQEAGDPDPVKYARSQEPTRYHLPWSDDDSALSACIAACRWRGYNVDTKRVAELKEDARIITEEAEVDFNSTQVCYRYLTEVMDDTEKLALELDGKPTTKGIVLENISKWTVSGICEKCDGMGCVYCDDTGLNKTGELHPAAKRARHILDSRRAKKAIELYDKLLTSKRLHASFRVIGTLSGRMSGGDGLNPQGINRDKKVRSAFPLADFEEGYTLCGGDFSGSQVSIADAVYGDPVLHEKLLSGLKIHALFGLHLFPGMTYDEIVATAGLPGDQDKYGRSKNGVFAMLFGGEAFTLMNRVGISEDAANKAYQSWIREHVVWGKERKKYFDMFCSMRQPNGLGTRVEWAEPADYVESIFGFKRYFTLENRICKALFELAEDPPKDWQRLKVSVVRREKVQTACGAVRSALFAAAFNVQSANMRAAANHVIQSPEATFVKVLQRRIWDIQPAGINDYIVQPMNIHDELMVPTKDGYAPEVTKIVKAFVTEYKQYIPLLEIDWSEQLKSWADK